MAKGNIVDGWGKCLELGLFRVSRTSKSSYIPNINKKVKEIIIEYVQEPRLLRNKIAHGQWKIALNRNNDNTNIDLTNQISNLNVVQLNVWKIAHQGLANIIEVLIESPERAFHRDYWHEISKLEAHLKETKNWSLADKIKLLKDKKNKYNYV